VGANGASIANRAAANSSGATLNITVADWEDTRGTHTSNQLVNILGTRFFMPQLGKLRRIWICLPETYNTNATKRYPVLYMHDGQNLFDGAFAPFGEWRVDENLLTLGRSQPNLETIVVGIDHGGSDRLNELSPYVNAQYGGGQGEGYARFIVETLKPFIDSMFRTLPQREFTGIGGSSMGGIMSQYAGSKYQSVFSKLMVFSPAFWFSNQVYADITRFGHQPGTRVHFVAGQNEGANMVANIRLMETTLRNAGFPASDIRVDIKADGQHSEWFWAREFNASWRWLMQNTPTSNRSSQTDLAAVFYKSQANKIVIESQNTKAYNYQLLDASGKLLKASQATGNYEISTSEMKQGVYILRLSGGHGFTHHKLLVY
jgi:predicted alpha/beta superfamily hydrolase